MNPKRIWLGLAGGAVAAAGLCGYLIHLQYGKIDAARAEVARLRTDIAASRKLLTGTPQLEREVIVLRETEEAIKEILPDETDINNLVRDLRRFEEDSEVRITGLKKKTEPARRDKGRVDFTKVTYQITLESDAFELLSFLDRIESHSRFMSVPTFKIGAASRRQIAETGVPAHKVQLDVETYVYEPQTGHTPVKIDGYARKRELLLGEISRRRAALQVQDYAYHGQRARRDPWVDPRVPLSLDDEPQRPPQEQIAAVEELSARMQEVQRLWSGVRQAGNVIEEMTLRAELERKLTDLESDTAKLLEQGWITFPVAERRLQFEVVEPVARVRGEIADSEGGRGPTIDALRELLAAMSRDLAQGDHQMALSAFATVEARLDLAAGDPVRRGLVDSLRKKAEEARILADFSKLKIDIKGVAIMEKVPPVALINGKAVGEGDAVDKDLVIRAIRQGEIEFIFRGVVLVRRF